MRSRLSRWMRVVIALIGAAVSATPARAELVFFATGRSLSVRGHRVDGDLLVLSLRSGGEIICERSVIVRIEPDEVPYPEPQLGTPDQPASVGGAYAALVDQIAAEQGIDGHMAKLVKAVIHVESAYQERARSRKGAMGLMQLMPETARQYAVADPYEPRSNIEAGIKHLKSLLARFELPLALAAYNAGEEAVRRFGGIPPYPETRSYVSRVLAELGR